MSSALKPAVVRWRDIVSEELASAKAPMPTNLVLALIQQESGGQPGLVAGVGAGDGSHAAGLMKCIEAVRVDYNRLTGGGVSQADLRGADVESARKQVRVGVWLLARKWGQVRAYLDANGGPTDTRNVALLADNAYAMGWGSLKRQLVNLEAAGRPLTEDALVAHNPEWGRPANDPLRHARVVWARYEAAEGTVGPIPAPLPEEEAERPFAYMAGAAALALVVIVVLALAKR
jgi:hypothetical protein